MEYWKGGSCIKDAPVYIDSKSQTDRHSQICPKKEKVILPMMAPVLGTPSRTIKSMNK